MIYYLFIHLFFVCLIDWDIIFGEINSYEDHTLKPKSLMIKNGKQDNMSIMDSLENRYFFLFFYAKNLRNHSNRK